MWDLFEGFGEVLACCGKCFLSWEFGGVDPDFEQRHVDAGMIFVNNYNRAAIGTPFGGMKQR